MEVTIDFLLGRLAEFKMQKEDALLQLGACNGAIQFCNFLIQQLEEEGGTKKPPSPSPRKKRGGTKPPPEEKDNGR